MKASNDVFTVGILLARFGTTFVKYSLKLFAILTGFVIFSLFFINNFVNKSPYLTRAILYCLKF